MGRVMQTKEEVSKTQTYSSDVENMILNSEHILSVLGSNSWAVLTRILINASNT